MKRAALGALLISLVAGSTAFAGTFIPADNNHRRNEREHRQDQRRHDNHQNNHRNDGRNGHRNDGRHDRDDRRWDGRRDNDHRGHDGRRDDRRWDDRRHDNRHDNRYNYRHDHRWDGKRYDRRFERGRWHWGTYHRPHGYVHRHWVRGNRLPHAYYASHYVIRDYHDCGLRRPPYGYHWVRVNNDAVLAVIATGVILDVVYNQFW
jgi:Ni/Co efflux regulator RcnB